MDQSVQLYEVESPQYRPRMLSFSGAVTTQEAEEGTITFDTLANTDPGDYVVLYDASGNAWAVAADTTGSDPEPTGDIWAAIPAGRRAQADISGETTDAEVAAVFVTSFGALTGFNAQFTLTDNTDGTVDYVLDVAGAATNAAPHNEDDSGAGSIGVAVTNEGVTGAVELANGKFDGTATYDGVGTYTIAFEEAFLRAPEIAIMSKSDNRVGRVTASAVGSVTIEMQNLSGGAAIDGDFGLMVLGSDAKDAIL